MRKQVLVTVPDSTTDAEMEEIVAMIPDILMSLCGIFDATAEVDES